MRNASPSSTELLEDPNLYRSLGVSRRFPEVYDGVKEASGSQ